MALKAVAAPLGSPVGGSGTVGTIPVWGTTTTTLTDSPLTVSGSNVTGAGAIRATGTAATAPAFTGSDTDTGIYFPAANQVRFSTAGALAIAIDASQNVGIGTASPTQKLDVRGASAFLNAGTDGVYGDIAFIGSSSYPTTYLHKIKASVSNTTTQALLTFALNSGVSSFTDVMTLRGDGNVGIGTASPLGALDVRGGSPAIISANSTTRYGFTQWVDAASLFRVATDGAFPVALFTNAIERMRISSAGAAAADSQVAIGTTSFTSGCSLTVAKSIDCSQSAQGLKLPATPGNADANTIDCYVDGGATAGGVAYTPTTTNFGGTISSITGRYVRVGGVVFARVDILGTALTTTAFSSTVTAPAIAASGNFAVCIRASSGTQASAYHISGGSTVEFSTSIASSSQITLTWFYFV